MVQLTTIYYANIAYLMPSLVYWGIWYINRDSYITIVDPWEELWEIFAYVFMWFLFMGYHALVYLIPALTLSFYMLFGADFFLFQWTDNLGLYFITRGVSQQGFNLHAIVSVIALLLVFSEINAGDDFGFELTIFLAYTVPAALLEYLAWNNGVNAARRIDPTWNEHRGKLYPPMFYSRGWVQDEPYPEPDQQSAIQDVSSIVKL